MNTDTIFTEFKRMTAPIICKCAVCGKQFNIAFYAKDRVLKTPDGKKVCSAECEEISRKGLKR